MKSEKEIKDLIKKFKKSMQKDIDINRITRAEHLIQAFEMVLEENKDLEEEVQRIKFISSYGILDEMKKADKYKKFLEKIKEIIKNLEKEEILSFPDLSLKDNVQIIIKQCNKGYIDILNLINENEVL